MSETIKVRIAVAVCRDAHGELAARCEVTNVGARRGLTGARETTPGPDGEHWFFVTAEIPLPTNDEPTVAGEVRSD